MQVNDKNKKINKQTSTRYRAFKQILLSLKWSAILCLLIMLVYNLHMFTIIWINTNYTFILQNYYLNYLFYNILQIFDESVGRFPYLKRNIFSEMEIYTFFIYIIYYIFIIGFIIEFFFLYFFKTLSLDFYIRYGLFFKKVQIMIFLEV